MVTSAIGQPVDRQLCITWCGSTFLGGCQLLLPVADTVRIRPKVLNVSVNIVGPVNNECVSENIYGGIFACIVKCITQNYCNIILIHYTVGKKTYTWVKHSTCSTVMLE